MNYINFFIMKHFTIVFIRSSTKNAAKLFCSLKHNVVQLY